MNQGLSTPDLRPSERAFTFAMQRLGFGRFEFLRIENGELVLNPWPTTVRGVRFGSTYPARLKVLPTEFELKKQVAEFFAYVRALDAGEILTLEVQHGLPFSMEVEMRAGRDV
jgi:hypothetical protein